MDQFVLVDINELRQTYREVAAVVEPQKNEAWFRKEAAAYLRTTPDEVDRMAEAGELPGRKIKGRWRFSSIALFNWLAGEEKNE